MAEDQSRRHLHALLDVEGFDPSKVPVELVDRLYRYRAAQDQRQWPSPRTGDMPEPPWPSQGNPMLEYLLMRAADDAGATSKVLFSAYYLRLDGGARRGLRPAHDGVG